MKGIIDRFEEDIVVVEVEGRMLNIPRQEVSSGAKEGDVLLVEAGEWRISPSATAAAKKNIDKLADGLWEK